MSATGRDQGGAAGVITLVVWIATLSGIALGAAPLRFWWRGLASVFLLAALFWLARFATIMLAPDDVGLSEDYLDHLDLPVGLIEYGFALIWVSLCYGLGDLIGWVGRRLIRRAGRERR
jgi:hypothetical protein